MRIKAERPLRVVFFKTDAGNEPVRDWLKSLSKDECKIIGTDILSVQYAWPVGKPLVDSLGGGIWEVRSLGKSHRPDLVRSDGSGNRAAAWFHQETAKNAAVGT